MNIIILTTHSKQCATMLDIKFTSSSVEKSILLYYFGSQRFT